MLLLLIIFTFVRTGDLNIKMVEKILESEQVEKIEAEKYTERVTPLINTQVQYILMSDPNVSNVILLSYHNNQHSSQGFSYRYITYITEKFKSADDELHEELFKELSYVSYGEEFSKIHSAKYLSITNVEDIKYTFPKLYKKIQSCNAEAVTFLPIEGTNDPVGMIIVLYDRKPSYDINYYARNISPYLQRLATILDYNNFKKNIN